MLRALVINFILCNLLLLIVVFVLRIFLLIVLLMCMLLAVITRSPRTGYTLVSPTALQPPPFVL